jgi:hypothetical protein
MIAHNAETFLFVHSWPNIVCGLGGLWWKKKALFMGGSMGAFSIPYGNGLLTRIINGWPNGYNGWASILDPVENSANESGYIRRETFYHPR